MSAVKPCTLDGVVYPSRSAAAEALGLSITTICLRLKPAEQHPDRYWRRPSKTSDVVTLRKCLKHGGMFRSHHVGERICPTCKDTHSWRSGISGPPEVVHTGRRR